MFEIVFPVLTKIGMECHTEQSVRPSLAEDIQGHIGEESLYEVGSAWLQEPDLAGLKNNHEGVAGTGELAEPHQAIPNIAGLVHVRKGKSQLLREERTHLYRSNQLGDIERHAAITGQGRGGLLQGNEILDEVGKLLMRHSGLQSLRHQGDRATPLVCDFVLWDADVFSI